ncbi:MAG: NAD(P)/FAD-dependent oxidoreductase [Pseudomonadota bacterium]
MEAIETLVIGAGVIGLAVARALAQRGREVLVVEVADAFGTETSARNSEVIHAGIYYPTGSLKAQMCAAGARQLYAYCEAHHVSARKCGKLIVATEEDELPRLGAILAQAQTNGTSGIRRISAADAMAREPALRCVGALWSPETGIVDSHGLMLALLGDAEGAGAMLALNAPVTTIAPAPGGFHVGIGGPDAMTIHARELVNTAGHNAPRLGAALHDAPRPYLAKGSYFRLEGRAPFSSLIYPAPVVGGLGVHLTLDQGGQARFGPDVEWVETMDYRVEAHRGDSFYAAVRRYWPDLPNGALSPDYSGIRPKLSGPDGRGITDFVVAGPRDHQVPGYLALYGIESPGLTSCLALADHAVAKLS